MADSPILDLVTTKPRKQVRIDDVSYDVRLSEDLSLYEGRKLDALMRQLSDIEAIEQMTAEQGVEYDALLGRLVAMALPDIPERVVAALSTGKRKAIVVTFFMLSALSGQTVRANTEKAAAQSTGPKPFPASSGTTAARRRRGSKPPSV